jgi:hypothetical protein
MVHSGVFETYIPPARGVQGGWRKKQEAPRKRS